MGYFDQFEQAVDVPIEQPTNNNDYFAQFEQSVDTQPVQQPVVQQVQPVQQPIQTPVVQPQQVVKPVNGVISGGVESFADKVENTMNNSVSPLNWTSNNIARPLLAGVLRGASYIPRLAGVGLGKATNFLNGQQIMPETLADVSRTYFTGFDNAIDRLRGNKDGVISNLAELGGEFVAPTGIASKVINGARNIPQIASQFARANRINRITDAVTNNALKRFPKPIQGVSKFAVDTIKRTPRNMLEGAGIIGTSEIVKDARDGVQDKTTAEHLLDGATEMALLDAGMRGAFKLGKAGVKTAYNKGAGKLINKQLEKSPKVAHALANTLSAFGKELRPETQQQAIRKYQVLENALRETGLTPEQIRFLSGKISDDAINALIRGDRNAASDIKSYARRLKKQGRLIEGDVPTGDVAPVRTDKEVNKSMVDINYEQQPKKPSINKPVFEQISKDDENIINRKQEKQPENVQDDLTPVKEEKGINTPKEDLTPVKNDSDMSGKVSDDIKTEVKPEEQIVENKTPNKLQEAYKKMINKKAGKEIYKVKDNISDNISTTQYKDTEAGKFLDDFADADNPTRLEMAQDAYDKYGEEDINDFLLRIQEESAYAPKVKLKSENNTSVKDADITQDIDYDVKDGSRDLSEIAESNQQKNAVKDEYGDYHIEQTDDTLLSNIAKEEKLNRDILERKQKAFFEIAKMFKDIGKNKKLSISGNKARNFEKNINEFLHDSSAPEIRKQRLKSASDFFYEHYNALVKHLGQTKVNRIESKLNSSISKNGKKTEKTNIEKEKREEKLYSVSKETLASRKARKAVKNNVKSLKDIRNNLSDIGGINEALADDKIDFIANAFKDKSYIIEDLSKHIKNNYDGGDPYVFLKMIHQYNYKNTKEMADALEFIISMHGTKGYTTFGSVKSSLPEHIAEMFKDIPDDIPVLIKDTEGSSFKDGTFKHFSFSENTVKSLDDVVHESLHASDDIAINALPKGSPERKWIEKNSKDGQIASSLFKQITKEYEIDITNFEHQIRRNNKELFDKFQNELIDGNLSFKEFEQYMSEFEKMLPTANNFDKFYLSYYNYGKYKNSLLEQRANIIEKGVSTNENRPMGRYEQTIGDLKTEIQDCIKRGESACGGWSSSVPRYTNARRNAHGRLQFNKERKGWFNRVQGIHSRGSQETNGRPIGLSRFKNQDVELPTDKQRTIEKQKEHPWKSVRNAKNVDTAKGGETYLDRINNDGTPVYRVKDNTSGLTKKEFQELKEAGSKYGLNVSQAKALTDVVAGGKTMEDKIKIGIDSYRKVFESEEYNYLKNIIESNEKAKIEDLKLLTNEQALERKINGYASAILDKSVEELTAREKHNARLTILDMIKNGHAPVYSKAQTNSKADTIETLIDGLKTKEGAYGKQTGKQVKGAIDETYAKKFALSALQDYNKTQTIVGVLNSVVNDFAKSKPANGYVPINTKVLSYVMNNSGSKEMVDTIMKGYEATRKAFRGEFSKYLSELSKTSKDDIKYIPENLYNVIFDGKGENLKQHIKRYGVSKKSIGTALDLIMNPWKRNVLGGSPSWVVNNAIGNFVLIAEHSDNPVQFIDSIVKAIKSERNDYPEEMFEHSLVKDIKGDYTKLTQTGYHVFDAFYNTLTGSGNFKSNMNVITDNKFLQATGKVLDAIGWSNKQVVKIFDKMFEINDKVELFSRKVAYQQALSQASKQKIKSVAARMNVEKTLIKDSINNPEEIKQLLESVQTTLGDYKKFNSLEQRVLKRVVPFYSWYRTLARHDLKMLKENPARFVAIYKAQDNIRESNEDRKEYQKLAIGTGIKDSRSGKELLWNKEHAFPQSTWSETSDSPLSASNNLLGVTANAIAGKKATFHNLPIEDKRYINIPDFNNGGKDRIYDTKEGDFVTDKNGKIADKMPVSVRAKYFVQNAIGQSVPLMNTNVRKAASLVKNTVKSGGKEPLIDDKQYDTSYGGYLKGEPTYREIKVQQDDGTYETVKVPNTYKSGKGKKRVERYSSSSDSLGVQLSKIAGLGLESKRDLNKKEKEDLKRAKRKRLNKRFRDNQQ